MRRRWERDKKQVFEPQGKYDIMPYLGDKCFLRQLNRIRPTLRMAKRLFDTQHSTHTLWLRCLFQVKFIRITQSRVPAWVWTLISNSVSYQGHRYMNHTAGINSPVKAPKYVVKVTIANQIHWIKQCCNEFYTFPLRCRFAYRNVELYTARTKKKKTSK